MFGEPQREHAIAIFLVALSSKCALNFVLASSGQSKLLRESKLGMSRVSETLNFRRTNRIRGEIGARLTLCHFCRCSRRKRFLRFEYQVSYETRFPRRRDFIQASRRKNQVAKQAARVSG
jgi:hypothetical protein